MTALAQTCAGLALVMCFGMLRARQTGTAALLLLVQSAAVSVAAVAMYRPVMAVPPLVLASAVWAFQQRSTAQGLSMRAVGGANLGLLAGAALTILCQSQGALAQPLAITLMGILLAATQPYYWLQAMALVVVQNGIALAGCMAPVSISMPVACLLLPAPLAAALMVSYPSLICVGMLRRHARWLGNGRVALSAAGFLATFFVPLAPLGAVFAPLLAFDGLLRAWAERRRFARAPFGHAAAMVRMFGMVVAVASPSPFGAWIAIVIVAAAALAAVQERRWQESVQTFVALAFVLLGLVLLRADGGPFAYLGLAGGSAVAAAMVPDLAVPLLVLILRQATSAAWSPEAGWMCGGVAVLGLLVCAARLARRPAHRLGLLHLAQAAVALMAIATNQPDGRFAAMILLILLTLTRAAGRLGGAAGAIASVGLAGIPPFGVFPALILVVLAFREDSPWLLLPLGGALFPMARASLPRAALPRPNFPVTSFAEWRQGALPSLGWLPLALAFAVGFLTPDSLTHWLRLLTVAQP